MRASAVRGGRLRRRERSGQALKAAGSDHQLQQLVGKQGQNSEHDVRVNLAVASHSDLPATEVILEPAVGPLDNGALLEPLRRGRVEGHSAPLARVGGDDWNLAQLATTLLDQFGVISGVHQ